MGLDSLFKKVFDDNKKDIKKLEKQMKKAAAELNFEAAAELRDKLIELKKHMNEME